MLKFTTFILAVVLLTACGTKLERDPNDVQPLVEETSSAVTPSTASTTTTSNEVKLIGFIKKIAVSLSAQGTHVLLSTADDSAKVLAILKSDKIDLNQYLDQQVEVQGTTQVVANSPVQLLTVANVISITEKKEDSAMEELRRLARSYTTPYNFTPDDQYQTLSYSESAGTMNVQVLQKKPGATTNTPADYNAYLVKMLRRGDAATGAWEIYEIKDVTGTVDLQQLNLAQMALQEEGTTPVTSTENPATTTEASAVSTTPASTGAVIKTDSAVDPTDAKIMSALQSVFKSLLGLSVDPSLLRIDVVDGSYIYVYYTVGDEYKLALLSFTAAGETYQFTKVASFKSGTETDWVKEEGENVAKAKAARVYKPGASGWEKRAELKDGWRFYENSKYQLQVPYYWYYRLRASNMDFSDRQVEDGNVLLSIDLADNYANAAQANPGESEESLTVGNLSGVKRTYADGSVKALLQDSKGQAVIVSAKAEAKYALETVLEAFGLK